MTRGRPAPPVPRSRGSFLRIQTFHLLIDADNSHAIDIKYPRLRSDAPAENKLALLAVTPLSLIVWARPQRLRIRTAVASSVRSDPEEKRCTSSIKPWTQASGRRKC